MFVVVTKSCWQSRRLAIEMLCDKRETISRTVDAGELIEGDEANYRVGVAGLRGNSREPLASDILISSLLL